MKRREFIALLGSTAATWPLITHAQTGRVLRAVFFSTLPADDPEMRARSAAFIQGLQELGWIVGRNIQLDIRIGPSSAAEVLALAPDIIVTTGTATLAAAMQLTRTVPIVFVQAADPVGGGFVESLARPGTNATGFTAFEYGISGKWLELLKEIAPSVTRVAVLRDSTIAAGAGQLGAIQSVASTFRVELHPVSVLDSDGIDRAISTFVRGSSGGLIVVSGRGTAIHRELIIKLAARHRLPAIYPYRYYVTEGGLACYGPNNIDQYRRAAGYVDRILKGEKPANLPVQAPTRYETVVNLKTAKALGLEVPPMLLARADEVIE